VDHWEVTVVPNAAPLSPLGVSVLSLLSERPMHPYEMYQLLMERHEDRVVKIHRGSLYHTVDRLAADRLARATGTAREGNRPERTTYQITAAGREQHEARLAELLAVPLNEYPLFTLGITDAHRLPLALVLEHLCTRVRALEDNVAESAASMAEVRARKVAARYWLDIGYTQAMRTAEIAWLRGLIADLRAKRITWQDNTPKKEVAQ